MSAGFSWLSPVYFDELDLNGVLHNTRFAVHVERAQSALFEQLGLAWTSYAERDPDLRYVVRDAPYRVPGSAGVTGRAAGRAVGREARPDQRDL